MEGVPTPLRTTQGVQESDRRSLAFGVYVARAFPVVRGHGTPLEHPGYQSPRWRAPEGCRHSHTLQIYRTRGTSTILGYGYGTAAKVPVRRSHPGAVDQEILSASRPRRDPCSQLA